jgi:excisionase family DNA binding protein
VGLKDFVSGQSIEIIEWVDDSHDTLAFRFPDEDRAIKRGAQLIVRESQIAQFVYLGEFADTFPPGRHTLITANIPVLTRLRSWKYGFESPFKADIYFVATRLFTGNEWGTSNPIMVHDPELGVVRLRAFGTYDFRVVDPKRFLRDVAATHAIFGLDEFTGTTRSRIVATFSDALVASHVPALDIASRYLELGTALLPLINPALRDKYGIEMVTFVVENVSVPTDVEQAIDAKSALTTIGNLDDYVKYQMAQHLAHAGAAAGAGIGTELAVGMTMAQRMMNQLSGAPPPGASVTETLSPAETAKALGVAEADVMASLEAGKLKGTRVGSQWRITRAQIAQFLQ